MTYEHILVDHDGAITPITMNRPERRNALSDGAHGRADRRLSRRRRRGARRASSILAGNGPAFCAGHDLREMLDRDLATYRRLFDRCVELMTAIQAIPQPVIAQVHGIATAAGCQLVATCDLAVASEDARFATPGREHRALLHDADGGADARDRPQARHGDAADRRRDRRADRGRLGTGRIASSPPPSSPRRRARSPSASPPPAASPSRSASRPSTRRSISTSRKAYAYAKEVMSMNALAADAQEGMCAFVEKRAPRWSDRER